MLRVVKIPLKGKVGSHALNSHGNYIVDHGKSWKNSWNCVLNFCGNPGYVMFLILYRVTRQDRFDISILQHGLTLVFQRNLNL